MKLKIIALILISCLKINAQTEHTSSTISIKDLELPTAPALTLLDQASTTIETAQNIQALTTSVVNGLSTNFAVEFSPYMMFKKNKDYYEYYGFKDKSLELKSSWFSSIYNDLQISVAKVQVDPNQYLSIGVKTNLIKVLPEDYEKKFKHQDSIIEEVIFYNRVIINEYTWIRDQSGVNKINFAIFIDSLSSKKIKNIETEIKNNSYNKLGNLKQEDIQDIISKISSFKDANITWQQFLISLNNEKIQYDKSRQELKKAYSILDGLDKVKKPIFLLDFAAAYTSIFNDNNYKSGKNGRWGLWSTANYNYNFSKTKENYFSVYLYGRYLIDYNQYSTKTEDTKTFDLGGKAEFQFGKFSFAYENIQRLKTKETRSVGTLKFKFNDKVTLNGGFGKNFENTNNMISFLGINWGFEGENNTTRKPE